MPQQTQRDTAVTVALAVGRLGNVSGPQLQTETRSVTVDLLKRLPRAEHVYLEQMMYATYCSSLRDNPALTEAQRTARIEAYNREVRATLHAGPQPVAKVDPRDAARAELARIPIEYSPEAFIKSAEDGKTGVVRLFLQAGIDPNVAGRRGETALMHAAGRGDLPMIEMLLKAGASAAARTSRDSGTALTWAASNGHVGAMRVLLKAGASRESFNDAFFSALRWGYIDAMRLMLEQGANPRADDGQTALRLTLVPSSMSGRVPEIFDLLLQRGWPVDARLKDGQTALMLAAFANNTLLMELLLKAGADVNLHCECPNIYNGGHSALTMAASKNGEQAVRLLLAAGARVDAPSKDGTPLMRAVEEYKALDLVKLLLSHGADPNKAQNHKGETALMHAALRQREYVPVLLDAGADVNARGRGGATALMRAAEADDRATVQMLLDKGADVQATTERGHTALMIAAMSGSVDTARLLLKRGARVDVVDEDNRSALAHASDRLKGEQRARMLALLGHKESK